MPKRARYDALGRLGIPFIGKGEVEGKGSVQVGGERGKSSSFERTGLNQVVKEIANSDYVVLVDDFHYMHRDVQVEAAKSLKDAVRLESKFCTAAVIHRGDDLRQDRSRRSVHGAGDLRQVCRRNLTALDRGGPERATHPVARLQLEPLATSSKGLDGLRDTRDRSQ